MSAIFHRIIICVGLTIALFLFVPKVDALTWDLDLKGETQIYNNVSYKQTAGYFGDNGVFDFTFTFDNVYHNTDNYKFAVFSIMSLSYYNDNGVITPNTASTPGGGGTVLFYDYTSNDFYTATQRIVLYGDYGGAWSNCEFQNNYLVCPINPGQKYNKLTFFYESSSTLRLRYRVALAPTMQLYNPYGVSSSDMQQQTDTIMNTDEQASSTYNNDYSTSSYDQAESSVNSSMDVDVSNFVFNPSQWIHAFNWIWQTLTSFVQINGKVFATITSFLTFSFVGLVIGRS